MHKAQQGMSAAILVAIISALIILYILFLPVEEREELLEEKTTITKKADKKNISILLSESPQGILDPAKKIDDRLLPNVFLIETTNAKVLEKLNPFTIRNGWFDKRNKAVSFKLADLENTDNVLLSFLAIKRKGILTAKLNNEIVYEFESPKANIIVELKKNLLKNENTIEFSVSSVGYRFWTTNEYSLDDIKIVGDITDASRQESQNIIELSEAEFNNLEKTTLRFVPFCKNVLNLGTLEISVNNRKVYSAVPVCDDRAEVPILSALNEGQNRIVFKTSSGSYSIEQIKVDLELKEPRVLTFFFEIAPEQIKDIVDKKKNANLTVEFVDDDKNKRAELSLNGHTIGIDQTKPIFTKLVSDKVREGNNFIELRPKTTLKIVNIKVFLVNK